MPYRIDFLVAARRHLRALPVDVQAWIQRSIDALGDEPRPSGTAAMVGEGGLLRIRVGNYRVMYDIDDGERLVTVVRIGHRKDVYRR